jgi:hypothetical protein
MDDAQYQDHAIALDDVVHDSIVTDAEAVERVTHALNGLDFLASHPSFGCDVGCQRLERPPNPVPRLSRQLPEGASSRRPELNAIDAQGSSERLFDRPVA